MSRVTLIEAAPWDAATGAMVIVRLAGGGTRGYNHLGFTDWKAGLASQPRFTAAIPFSQEGWTGGEAIPQVGTIRFYPTDPALLATISSYHWLGSPVTIKTGDDATASPTWTTEVTGTIAAIQCGDGVLDLTIADIGAALDVSLVTARFAGIGGLEGGIDALERIKRRSWGRVFDVEGQVLDKPNNIYEFGDPAFPWQSIDEVRDMGRAGPITVLASAGSAAATLAALVAATPTPGGGIVAPSIACVKWWTQPAGPLCCDAHGEIGAGYVETAPAIAAAILAAVVPVVTITNTAAAITARPGIAGLHIADESETIAEALDRLLLGVSLLWPLNSDGSITLREITFDSPAETLASQLITREAAYKPISRRRLGYYRNETIHSASDIAADVLEPDATGNLIPNAQLQLAGDGWTFNGTVTVEQAAAGWKSTNGLQFVGNGNAISARGTLENSAGVYVSTWAYRTAAAALSFVVNWYDATGALVGQSDVDATPGSVSAWEFAYEYVDMPAGAVAYEAQLEVSGNAGTVIFGGFRLGITEAGADVTARNAPLLHNPRPGGVIIKTDHAGAALSGQYPVALQFSRQRGNDDVTASTTWAIAGLTGTLTAANTSIDDTVGSPTRGRVTITSGIGKVTISATRGTEQVLTTSVELTADPADAPPVPESGGSTAVMSTSALADISSTADNVVQSVLKVTPAGTSVTVNASSLRFRNGPAGGAGDANIRMKHQWSLTGVGSWNDIGAFVDGTAQVPGTANKFGWIDGTDGVVTCNQTKTGLTAGVAVWFRTIAQAISYPPSGGGPITFAGGSVTLST